MPLEAMTYDHKGLRENRLHTNSNGGPSFVNSDGANASKGKCTQLIAIPAHAQETH
jgi:hypothetical protein